MFDPRRVFHWGYAVPDMEQALEAWRQSGAHIIVPPAPDPIQNVSCALLVFREAAPIELVAPLNEAHPLKSRLKKGGGLDHVCLFTDDIHADIADFEKRGAITVVAPCYGAVFDRTLAFLMTPVGLVVELMTRQPVGQHRTDPLSGFLA